MPDYRYVAIDPAGREKRGTVSGDDVAAARASLTARHWHVVTIDAAPARSGRNAGAASRSAAGRGRSLLRWREPRLNSRQLAMFTRQLATLIEVAPLEEALRTLRRQSEGAWVQAIIGDVHAGVLEGRRLADAMAAQPSSFPPLYRAMVAAGEATGALGAILQRVATLLERQAEVRSKLLATLAYPIVLALVAMAVVALLMIFVVPKVVEQFDDSGQRLPTLTRLVIALSDFAANWWWAVLAVLALVALAVARAMRVPAVKLRVDGWLLRLPLAGRLQRDLHAARFARTLATMVDSRLPLVEGLRLTIPTIRNAVLAQATGTLVEQVRAGGSLSAGMRASGLFPPLLTYMVASGESAGRLGVMLERAADYLEREFDRFTATSMALLEPAIIVIMGSLVALIILSILLPILQLQSLIGV